MTLTGLKCMNCSALLAIAIACDMATVIHSTQVSHAIRNMVSSCVVLCCPVLSCLVLCCLLLCCVALHCVVLFWLARYVHCHYCIANTALPLHCHYCIALPLLVVLHCHYCIAITALPLLVELHCHNCIAITISTALPLLHCHYCIAKAVRCQMACDAEPDVGAEPYETSHDHSTVTSLVLAGVAEH